jgi:hypothetical protein
VQQSFHVLNRGEPPRTKKNEYLEENPFDSIAMTY